MRMLSALAALSFGTCLVVQSGLTASAQDLELHIGRDGPQLIQRDRDRDDHRDRYDDRDRDRDGRRHHRRGDCDADEARDAARDEGFRHPRVVRLDDRIVVVEGMTRRGPDRIVFANRRGCPEIR